MRALVVFGGLAAIVSATYVARCAWWPLGRCRRCNGAGQRPARPAINVGPRWLRRLFTLPPKPCRRCGGRGRRIRVGRRVFESLRRLHTAGTRHDRTAAKK